jgi:hypothetical protein
MRKQVVIAILLLSVALFSFNGKEKSYQGLNVSGRASMICGPSFDAIYNQHSTAFVSQIYVTDPFSNHFNLGISAEPSDVISISDAGSQCGYAGGQYHFFVFISNPSSGSVRVVDQNNNVVCCSNIISIGHNYHMSFIANCATIYRIIVSNSSC